MPGFGHAEALDIEELVAAGRKQSLCPYYLSRNAVPGADLVLLPYNYLLDPSARAALKVHMWMWGYTVWIGAIVSAFETVEFSSFCLFILHSLVVSTL
jgi:hypothetical protein